MADSSSDDEGLKDSLYKKLKQKMQAKRKTRDKTSSKLETRSSKMIGNKNAQKNERKVDLGWLDFTEGEYRQVRIQSGGGIRHITVTNDTTVKDLLEVSKKLFFPGGLSQKGNIKDFSCHMRDVRKLPFDASNPSIKTLYETTKLTTIRLYLATEKVLENEIIDDDLLSIGSEISIHSSSPVPEDLRTAQAGPSSTSCPFSPASHSSLEQTDVSPVHTPNTPTVSFGPSSRAEVDPNATLPIIEVETEATSKTLVIRRSQIFQDMVQFFKDASITESKLTVRMVLPNGEIEMGEGSGVFVDALASFWDEFSKHTAGDEFKVPVLRHNFGADTWKAVGRIILKGWEQAKYFPISLAPPFMEEVLFGNVKSNMKDSFLKFVSLSERLVIQGAIEKFPDNLDELLDILDCYECRVLPSKSNFVQLLWEIGHKEIVQRPMFIADSMREVLSPLREKLSHSELLQLYEDLRPTAQKVIGRVVLPDGCSPVQRSVFGYLKRYIRSLEKNNLKKFLRFWTASDVLSFPELKVAFNEHMVGFYRRPIAHTCGQCLELPTTYESYIELKNEFDAILDSGIWVMDIA